MLQQCRGLVIGDKYSVQSRIGSEHTLASTAGEQNFERQIEALLQQKGFNASGESGQAAVTAIASGTIGTRSAVGEDERRTWKLVLGGLMAFLVLVGGAVAWLLVRRHRRQQEVAALASATQEAPPRARVAEQRASAPSAPPGPRAMICPVCGTQFDSNAEFCGLDGAVLVPEN